MKTKNDCKQYIYSRKEDEKKGINLFLWWRSLIPLCRSDQVFLDSYQKQTFLLKERKKKKRAAVSQKDWSPVARLFEKKAKQGSLDEGETAKTLDVGRGAMAGNDDMEGTNGSC